jgi:hypothetical protein
MTATSTNPFLTFGEAVEIRVASADQRHLLDRVATFGVGHRVDSRNPWFRELGMRVLGQLISGEARLCRHIGPGRGFGPMYTTMAGKPLRVYCRACFTHARPRLDPIDDNSCDRCSVYAKGGVFGSMLPVGPLMILFGVCGTCSVDLELRPAGEAAE